MSVKLANKTFLWLNMKLIANIFIILKLFLNLHREFDLGDGESPKFVYTGSLMKISEIIDAMQDEIVARKCFLVDVSVSRDNDVELVIESEEGTVTLDDCVELSRKFEEKFDREKEDYSLTIGSAGLDQPFKVLKQYRKAVGTEVQVMLKDGRKLKGVLTGASEDGITLKYSVKEAVEGKKRKELVEHEDFFAMDAVNGVIPVVAAI